MADTATQAQIEEGLSAGDEATEIHAGKGEAGRGLDFLSGIELEAAVELGRATLSIGQVLALMPGSVVPLDKMLGDPVEMLIRDRLVARGEVVVVDDRFGFRVTEIVSRAS